VYLVGFIIRKDRRSHLHRGEHPISLQYAGFVVQIFIYKNRKAKFICLTR